MTEIKKRTVYLLQRTDKEEDGTDVYVGSTSKTPRRRLSEHRCMATRSDSKLYGRMRAVGVDNWEIVPLFQRACDKETILGLERKWIKIMGADLNTYFPIITPEEKNQYASKYREMNKEKMADYLEMNKEKISKKIADCYEKNKQKKKYHCAICEVAYRNNYDLQRHLKTSRHFWKYIYSPD